MGLQCNLSELLHTVNVLPPKVLVFVPQIAFFDLSATLQKGSFPVSFA